VLLARCKTKRSECSGDRLKRPTARSIKKKSRYIHPTSIPLSLSEILDGEEGGHRAPEGSERKGDSLAGQYGDSKGMGRGRCIYRGKYLKDIGRYYQASNGKREAPMEIQSGYLDRFKVVKSASDAQQRNWERADAVIEVMKFLYMSEVSALTMHLEPMEMILLMEKAKKEGEKPKAFFKYLVNEQRTRHN
jgi:hypothetical protein